MRPSFNSSSQLLVAGASGLFAVGAAVFPLSAPDSPSVYAGPNHGPVNDAPVVHEPHRPHSADAAERWWLNCMVGMPHSADHAERAAAECW